MKSTDDPEKIITDDWKQRTNNQLEKLTILMDENAKHVIRLIEKSKASTKEIDNLSDTSKKLSGEVIYITNQIESMLHQIERFEKFEKNTTDSYRRIISTLQALSKNMLELSRSGDINKVDIEKATTKIDALILRMEEVDDKFIVYKTTYGNIKAALKVVVGVVGIVLTILTIYNTVVKLFPNLVSQ
jgi:chromosome segregation ATPase